MELQKTLEGTGEVYLDGEYQGQCSYCIEIWKKVIETRELSGNKSKAPGLKEIKGTISDIKLPSLSQKTYTLKLNDGKSVKFVVLGPDHVEFTSGFY